MRSTTFIRDAKCEDDYQESRRADRVHARTSVGAQERARTGTADLHPLLIRICSADQHGRVEGAQAQAGSRRGAAGVEGAQTGPRAGVDTARQSRRGKGLGSARPTGRKNREDTRDSGRLTNAIGPGSAGSTDALNRASVPPPERVVTGPAVGPRTRLAGYITKPVVGVCVRVRDVGCERHNGCGDALNARGSGRS